MGNYTHYLVITYNAEESEQEYITKVYLKPLGKNWVILLTHGTDWIHTDQKVSKFFYELHNPKKLRVKSKNISAFSSLKKKKKKPTPVSKLQAHVDPNQDILHSHKT